MIEAMRLPVGITRDDTEHGVTYYTEQHIRDFARQAIAEAEKQVSYSGNGTAGRENTTAPTGFFFQMPKAKQEPVAWYYEIDGSKAISFAKDGEPNKPWQGLYTHPDPDALHAAYMGGFYDGKKSKEKNT